MSSSDELFLDSLKNLPPLERAAAIAHRIYIVTARREGWTLRVAEEWADLSEESRRFNEESIATWCRSSELLERWLHAVLDVRIADRHTTAHQ
jgi:hypothetical protein